MGIVLYPNQLRNYCVFDERLVNQKRDVAKIKESLENSQSEDEVLENLYVLNLMLDEGRNDGLIDSKIQKDVVEIYPTLSKFNNTTSPNVQTFLAGIYRKIKVPDAFGPLCAMLIRNSINPPSECGFDPNEEIGGAILDYLA